MVIRIVVEDLFQVELTDSKIQQIRTALASANKELSEYIAIQNQLPTIHASTIKEVTPIAFGYITVTSFEEGYAEVSPFDIMEDYTVIDLLVPLVIHTLMVRKIPCMRVVHNIKIGIT